MILKIGNTKIDYYRKISVSLNYDSVASVFSIDLYFNPSDPIHRELFRPGAFPSVTIEHNGELLITGVLLSYKFKSSSQKELISISGYSKTGVLEDCEIPKSVYPLQSNGLTLRQIAEKLVKPFGIGLVVDPSIADRVDQKYNLTTASDTQSVKSYLADLAGQKHIMLTHDEKGNLVLSDAKINQTPVYDLSAGMPGLEFEFDYDGQRMHNEIAIQKQATKTGKGNIGTSTIANPYCSAFRPRIIRQTSGQEVDTSNAARNALSEELKGIPLNFSMDRWDLNGKILRPNTIITVADPELFLFNKTKFFVGSVSFQGDEVSETATVSCFLPEVFGTGTPKNIFI